MTIDRNDTMRQLLEMAVSYGRKKQSSQTGYLHYCYNTQDHETHLPIPIVENFLFALALLRSRQVENVTEAKTLLEGLLHFQNLEIDGMASGNFPIYLHEYPICKDRFIGVQVAGVIFWILKLYPQGLGVELKKRLEEAFKKAIWHAVKTHHEKTATYPTAVKIASIAAVGGHLINDLALVQAGEKEMERLVKNPDYSSWYCPKSISVILSGLTMVYPRLSDSPWQHFWKYLQETWHRHTCSYIGPALKEWQQGYEPQVTLYDLFLGYFTGTFSQRALKESPSHLEIVLIPVYEDLFAEPTYPCLLEGSFEGAKWSVYHGKQMAYSLMQNGSLSFNSGAEKGYCPLRLVWGTRERVHSLVCQGGNGQITSFNDTPGNLLISFELGESIEVEDREKSRQIIFYTDVQEMMEFLISGHKSSTFRLEDTVSMNDKQCNLALKFTLAEGEGRFIGHRMLGNRPAQLEVKKSQRFDAYDWQIFIRTVGRSPNCRIDVALQID